jgi:hypothetical protein
MRWQCRRVAVIAVDDRSLIDCSVAVVVWMYDAVWSSIVWKTLSQTRQSK